MSFLFLTYGPTHSGKTTFAKKFLAALGEEVKCIRIDNDEVDEFIMKSYPNLRADPAILATRTPANPDLRLLIPQFITGYALKEGYSVIVTAAHPRRVIRQAYYDIARERNAKVVLLIFRIDENQALSRIRSANRNTDILIDTAPGRSSSFQELFFKQKSMLEEPRDTEEGLCFKVVEIYPDNIDEVMIELVKTLKSDR